MLYRNPHPFNIRPVLTRPDNFVELKEVIPDIIIDLKYFTGDNFMGCRVDGYEASKLLITEKAALAVKNVFDTLAPEGLGLKVFDAYRPQRAVDHFMRWAEEPEDGRTQEAFYPRLEKHRLVPLGYLIPHSAHSRGSTIDLTLVSKGSGKELDLGSPFDFFDPLSWPDSEAVTTIQKANRMRLQRAMRMEGFLPLDTEWWHFTLQDEPYPETWFDFPIV